MVFVFRDCMKGDETENKKIGCTVNLLVNVHTSGSFPPCYLSY